MAQNAPAASIIVPCRNHAPALSRCLESLSSQQFEHGFEIIVVDSASDDAVAAVVGEHAPAALVRSRQPLLPGPARNLGVRSARGVHLLFIDADCVAETGWLTATVQALTHGAKLVGGPVLHGLPWHPVAVIDNLMQFSDLSAGRAAGAARLLPGCNLGMARADFEQLGGFPTGELTAGEDVLFCNRVSARWPGQVLFCPAMRVRHFGRSTLPQLWAHQQRFGFTRAIHGLELRPRYRRWGRYALLAPAVGLKRLSYMGLKAARSQPSALAAMMLCLPILLFAMTAWCVGFHRGCRQVREA
jgi:glycosyltransferase involved in cell wall biosynthesis